MKVFSSISLVMPWFPARVLLAFVLGCYLWSILSATQSYQNVLGFLLYPSGGSWSWYRLQPGVFTSYFYPRHNAWATPKVSTQVCPFKLTNVNCVPPSYQRCLARIRLYTHKLSTRTFFCLFFCQFFTLSLKKWVASNKLEKWFLGLG